MRTLLIFLLIVSGQLVLAQGYLPGGGRSMSMANATVAVEDEWAFFNNPAAITGIKKFKAGISYENRFLLKALQSQAAVAALPLGKGVLSLGAHNYGYTQFRSYRAGIGYGMKLSEHFSMGAQINYQGLALNENYGSINTMTADVGLFAEINPKWKVGLSVFDIGRAKLSMDEDDRFTTTMRLGTSYQFSDRVLISIEGNKDLDDPLRFRSGIEYQVVDDFYLRGGVATNRLELTFGMGYAFSLFRLDLGTSYDQILGWSPNFSLLFLNKKDQ